MQDPREAAEVRELGNALRFFRDVSGIVREPVETLHHRLVLLRMVYALTPQHVEEMVGALAESGLDIGKYNVDAVQKAVENDLFEMSPAVWVRFVGHLRVENCSQMLRELEQHYGGENAASPVLSFRVLARNAAGHRFNEQCGEHLTLFLHVYNNEARTSELLAHLLPTMGVCNVGGVALALSDKQSCPNMQHMLHDLVSVLGNTSSANTEALLAGMRDAENARRMTVPVSMQRACARPSIKVLRERIVREETERGGGGSTGPPPGLPIEPADWTRWSQSQRQVVQLLALMRADAVRDAPALLAHVIPAEQAAAFESYQLPSARQQQTLEAVMPALHRLAHVLEFANARVSSVLETFKEACLQHTLGNEQQQLLPLATLAQLYLIAHFLPGLQATAYRHVTAAFNSDIPSTRRHLRIPDTMSDDLSTRMCAFSSKNGLSPVFAEGVLRRLCV